MVIEDLIVGDVAEFYYFLYQQQKLIKGVVKEIHDNSVVFDVQDDKYYLEVPRDHLVYRNKRPIEIEEEKRKRQEALISKIEYNQNKHICGVNFIEKESEEVVLDHINTLPKPQEAQPTASKRVDEDKDQRSIKNEPKHYKRNF